MSAAKGDALKAIVRRFSREERANLAHALMHLEANKIADASAYGGWYCGNREQFVKRHKKAVALMRSLLTPNATGESRRTRRTLDPIVGSLEDGE